MSSSLFFFYLRAHWQKDINLRIMVIISIVFTRICAPADQHWCHFLQQIQKFWLCHHIHLQLTQRSRKKWKPRKQIQKFVLTFQYFINNEEYFCIVCYLFYSVDKNTENNDIDTSSDIFPKFNLQEKYITLDFSISPYCW